MTVKKEPAACSIGSPEQAARQNHLHRKPYPKAESLLSLKLFIGELLLFGNQQRKEFWTFFEALLVQFYQASPQNPPKGRLTGQRVTNVGQRVDR